MSVIRINEFVAKAGQGAVVRERLLAFDGIFKAMVGYESHQVLQGIDVPVRIVVFEVWESIEAHQASAKQIPVHAFEQMMLLLAEPPKGAYYLSSLTK